MKNKIILGGLSIFTIGIMMSEFHKLGKTYINFKRKSKKSWKYYE